MRECKSCKKLLDDSMFYPRAVSCKECYNQARRNKRALKNAPTRLEKISRTEKKCTVCGEVKELSMFYKHNGTLDKRNSHCKKCMSIKHKTIGLPFRIKRSKEIKMDCIMRLGGACSHCGLMPSAEWPIECFDFHHVSDKSNLLTHLITKSVAPKHMGELIKEVDKCIVLCANCHRRHHAASFIASE